MQPCQECSDTRVKVSKCYLENTVKVLKVKVLNAETSYKVLLLYWIITNIHAIMPEQDFMWQQL